MSSGCSPPRGKTNERARRKVKLRLSRSSRHPGDEIHVTVSDRAGRRVEEHSEIEMQRPHMRYGRDERD